MRLKSVTWFEIVLRCWSCFMISGELALGQRANFELIPGSLVYFGEIGGRNLEAIGETEGQGKVIVQQRLKASTVHYNNDHHHQQQQRHHHKHYLKEGQVFDVPEHGSTRDLPPNRRGRQGQLCRSRCKVIPDRDFCPTYTVEEIEAYDDDYTYSRENSLEYSEEYSGEDYEMFENDRRNGRRSKPRLTSSEVRGSQFEGENENERAGLQARNRSDDGSRNGKMLYVVYPSLTKFAVSRSKTGGNQDDVERQVGRNRVAVRQRRRQRRLRQRGRVVRLRPSGLEQEIIIRWDRVVERGPYKGGDIVLPEGVLLRPPRFRYVRNRWPKGIVPYEIDPSLNSCRTDAIFDAMDEIEDKTCIRFVERKKQKNFVDIRLSPYGCSSYVGMIGGRQHLNLSTGCFSKFTATHELMHALGFDHEQSREDRDEYIEIDFENVVRAKESQFELNPSFSGAGFPYDLRSIMHYSAFLFARNRCEPTIYPVSSKVNLCDLGIGNGKGGMTSCDIAKVNSMYKCGRKYRKKCKIEK